jgi:hypothetical protein
LKQLTIPISQTLYSFRPIISRLQDLYIDIYKAWQSTVGNEFILPSLASSSTWSINESGTPKIIDGELDGSRLLHYERILAFGCWIFLDGEETLSGERAARPAPRLREVKREISVYPYQYESTVDLLVQYFLPGFDKSIIDGRVLAQTTSSRNSLFFCPIMAAIGDHIFNLLPMVYPDPFRYFVFRDRGYEESWIKDIGDKINLKLGRSGYRRTLKGMGDPRRDSPVVVKDLVVMTCSLVGEAYGMTNMYMGRGFERMEWRRLSKRGTGFVFNPFGSLIGYEYDRSSIVTEEKILAIF